MRYNILNPSGMQDNITVSAGVEPQSIVNAMDDACWEFEDGLYVAVPVSGIGRWFAFRVKEQRRFEAEEVT